MNSVWNAIVTMTTVGYGDLFPLGHPGRFAIVLTSLAGSAILALLITAVETAFTFDEAETRVREAMDKKSIYKAMRDSASRIVSALVRIRALQKRYERHQKVKVWIKAACSAKRWLIRY